MIAILPFHKQKSGRHLPTCHQQKALMICQQILSGIHYQKVGGKKLRCNPAIVSFPLGRRYRLVASYKSSQVRSMSVMTHEAYNNFYRR